MPRRKFPSDGKSWWRCLTAILHDPRLNGDCPPDVAWGYIRLLALLGETNSRDGRITLDRRGLGFVFHREQFRHALRVARAGAARGLYALRVEGVDCSITVPKWPIIQGFATEVRNPKEEKNKEEKKEPPARPKSTTRKPRKTNPGTLCAEDLSPEQWVEVRGWRDRKHPKIDDLILRREWEKHSAYWRAEEKPRRNWVASFEKWLLKALEIQKADPRAERSQAPIVQPSREPPPPPLTEAEIDRMEKDAETARKDRRLKRANRTTDVSGKRRGRQVPTGSEPKYE